MSKMVKNSRFSTDDMNSADANSADQPLLGDFMQNNSALAPLNWAQAVPHQIGFSVSSVGQLMPVYGGAGAWGGSATSGGDAGAASGTAPSAPSTALSGGPITLTVGTTGGFVFNDTFDNTCSQGFINCVVAAEKTLTTLFTNSFTVSVSFTEASTAPTTSNPNPNALGNSWPSSSNVSYATLKNALPTADSLPASDPNSAGGSDWNLPEAYARLLGLSTSTPASGQFDDTVTLNTYYNWSYGQDVINGVIHELSEGIMGRVGSSLSTQKGAKWSTMDLFRYSAKGVHDYSNGTDGKTTYFSSDGTNLSSAAGLSFNNQLNTNGTTNNTGDTADWTQQAVFGTTGTGEKLTLTQTELDVLAALGWNAALPQAVFTATSADWQTPTAWRDGFMPITPQDALIGAGSTSTATSSANVTVNSIATGKLGTLNITGNSVFTATTGTQPNPNDNDFSSGGNNGKINVDVGSTLVIGNMFDNAGAVTLGTNSNSNGGNGVLSLSGAVTLSGGGNLYLGQESSIIPGNYTEGLVRPVGLFSNGSLINVDNTIAGGGTILLTNFDNQSKGVVDANQQSGHALEIVAGAFSNEGMMKVEGQSTLDFGWSSQTEQLSNTGTVAVYGQGDLAISGNFTVSGSGAMQFQGAGAEITSDGAGPATFTNASTINAYYSGQIGDIGTSHANDLTFVNTGTVMVSGSGSTLTLNTGGNMINDYSGTLEAVNGATLVIDSSVNTGQFPSYLLPYPPGGTIEAGSGGTVTLAATVENSYGWLQPGQIVIDGGKFIMQAGSAVVGVPINFTSNGGTLELHNPSSVVDVNGGTAGTINLYSAHVAITGTNEFRVDFSSGADNIVDLSNTTSYSNTVVNVSGYYGTVNLNSATVTVVGGIQNVNFTAGSGDSASLWNTGVYTNNVVGSYGSVSLHNAQAAIVGTGDMVTFSSGTSVANLWNTGSGWDSVYGSNGVVNMYNANATFIGSNYSIDFATSADHAALYNIGGNWDTVNGSNGTVDLNNATATITGSNNIVNLKSGSNTVTLSGGPFNTVNLSNNGSNSETIDVTGYVYQTANLTNASATIIGGIETINLTGSNTLDLRDTGVQTDNVYGSNDTVSLSNAKAAIVGDNDIVNLSSGSNVANLWNTGSAGDRVNGSTGSVNLINAMATFGSAYAGEASFLTNTGTLRLENSSSFSGTVAGLHAQDAIDFADIGFGASSTLGYSPNSDNSGGTLSVGDGMRTANIALLGSYMASTFVAASDGHGGTLVSEAGQASAQTPLLTQPH